jgi:hypothetical protein
MIVKLLQRLNSSKMGLFPGITDGSKPATTNFLALLIDKIQWS